MCAGFGARVDGYGPGPELLSAQSRRVDRGGARHAWWLLVSGREERGMEDVPGVCAVLVSRESEGMTRTPVCFHWSGGGDVGAS